MPGKYIAKHTFEDYKQHTCEYGCYTVAAHNSLNTTSMKALIELGGSMGQFEVLKDDVKWIWKAGVQHFTQVGARYDHQYRR